MNKVCAARIVEVIEWEDEDFETTKFCYAILCLTTSRIKIGITDDYNRRFKELQMHSPTKLNLTHLAVTVGNQLEQHLFRKYSKYRVHGEWFDFKGDNEKLSEIDDVFHEYYHCTGQEYLWWNDAERAEFKIQHGIKEEAAA